MDVSSASAARALTRVFRAGTLAFDVIGNRKSLRSAFKALFTIVLVLPLVILIVVPLLSPLIFVLWLRALWRVQSIGG